MDIDIKECEEALENICEKCSCRYNTFEGDLCTECRDLILLQQLILRYKTSNND